MQNHIIDSIIKEVNTILSQLPTNQKGSQSPRTAFSILRAALEEIKQANQNRLVSGDFIKFLQELQQQFSPKAVFLSFTVISQIVSFKLINSVKEFEDILSFLKVVGSLQEDDNFQLKLSQLVGTLISSEFLEFENIGYVEKCLFILLYLKDSKNFIVSSVAKTHLQSIIITVCKNHKDKFQHQYNPQQINDVKITVSKLIVDFIFIIDGQKQGWYPQNSVIERQLGLEWLNTILLETKELVFNSQENITLLKSNLIPACKKVLKQYQPPDIRKILVVQIFCCFTRLIEGNQAEFIDLFDLFTKYIGSSENSLCKTISLQCVIYFVRSQCIVDCLLQISDFNDQKNQFFMLLSTINEISRTTETTYQEIGKITNVGEIMTEHFSSDLTISNNAIVIKFISDFYYSYATSLVRALQSIQNKELYRKFIKVVEHSSRYSLNSIKSLLSKEINEIILDTCLNSISMMIHLLGEVFNKQIQSEFIQLLIDTSLPPKEVSKLSTKHLFAIKTILKILNIHGNQIDYTGWISFLSTLNSSDKLITQNKIIRQGTQEEVNKFQILNTVSNMYEELFKKSHSYNDNMFLTMLDAVNQVTLIDMSEQAQRQPKIYNFLFSQIPNTLKINFYRIDIFWELITAHLLILSNSKQLSLRESGATHLSQLIIMGFQYMAKYYKLKPIEDQRREQERIKQIQEDLFIQEDKKLRDQEQKLKEYEQKTMDDLQQISGEEQRHQKIENQPLELRQTKNEVQLKKKQNESDDHELMIKVDVQDSIQTEQTMQSQKNLQIQSIQNQPPEQQREKTSEILQASEQTKLREFNMDFDIDLPDDFDEHDDNSSPFGFDQEKTQQQKEQENQNEDQVVHIQEIFHQKQHSEELDQEKVHKEKLNQEKLDQQKLLSVESIEPKDETHLSQDQTQESNQMENQTKYDIIDEIISVENNLIQTQLQIQQNQIDQIIKNQQKESQQNQQTGIGSEIFSHITQVCEAAQTENQDTKLQSGVDEINEVDSKKVPEQQLQQFQGDLITKNVEISDKSFVNIDRNFEKFTSNQILSKNPPQSFITDHLIEKDKWNELEWQGTILSPWVQLLTIKYAETKLIIMQHVQTLLQSNGHQINSRGWERILSILHEASQDQTSGFAKQGLKSIEHMINLHLTMIDQDKVPLIYEIIENFRKNSVDQNVNLEFCDMLWQFGDYFTKMESKYDEMKINYMKKIFGQLSNFCLEDNKEIRNQSLHIICNLLLHSSSSLGCKFWNQIFEDYYFVVMKNIINAQQGKTFSESKENTQWQTTCKSLVRTSNKLFKRYFQLLDEEYQSYTYEELDSSEGDLNNNPKFKKLFEINTVQISFLTNMATLLNQVQIQMHLEIVEALKDMFMLKPQENQLIQDAFLDNLQQIRMIFTLVPPSIIYTKVILNQVTNQVLQYITLLIRYYYPWKRVNQTKYIESIISLYLKVLGYPSLVQQTHPNLRTIIDYSYYMIPYDSFIQLVTKYPEVEDVISELLIQIYSLTPTHVFNDYCIRNFTLKGTSYVSSKNNFRLELSLKVLKNMSQIMEHRWKNNYHRWFYAIKKQQSTEQKEKEIINPIWQFAYETFFELSVQILLQPSKPYDLVFDIFLKNYDIIQSTESITLLVTYLQESQLKLFLNLESKSLQFLYKKFIHSPFAIVKIFNNYKDSKEGCQKILQMSKDFSWILFQMISPENYYEPQFKQVEGQESQEQESVGKLNIALQCFRYLVELIHFQDTQNLDEQRLKEKDKHQIWIYYLRERSKIVLPYLLAKINIIFKQYFKQQIQIEKQQSITDKFIEEILDLIISLRIPIISFPLELNTEHHLGDVHQLREPDSMNFLKSDCGHLFYLYPMFLQFLEIPTSNEIESAVKKALEKIYSKFGFMRS